VVVTVAVAAGQWQAAALATGAANAYADVAWKMVTPGATAAKPKSALALLGIAQVKMPESSAPLQPEMVSL